VRDTTAAIDCDAPGYDGGVVPAGLVAYSCTGSARPDDSPTFDDGVPRGVLCADKGPIGDAGTQAYCCTPDTTSCASDPVIRCEGATTGVQCWGNNRPESLNPTLTCSNGFYDDQNLLDYCCTGQPEAPLCQQTDSVRCDPRLLGFLCQGDRLPRGEDLGSNKSRADYFRPVCSIAQPAENPEYNSYCCYMPAPVPAGGTCVWDPEVVGCAPGRFGFSCYGPDTPNQDYFPMHCDPGVHGTNAEGYPATIFCCDFR
jgi:hypothetical protein